MRALVLLIAALCASACASPGQGEHVRAQRTVGTAQFTLDAKGVDRSTLRMLDKGLELAGVELLRWGGLTAPVTLYVLPDQRSLREAIGHPEYTWISAWARYDTVHLQSPRSWSFLPPRQQDVDRLLLHELSHVMLYQRAGDATSWRFKEIPLWFDEGLASVTAQQAYRWPGLEDLARWYDAHGEDGADPLRPSPELYRRRNGLVYGAAHHALTFLVQRYGEPVVVAIMDAMGEGRRFDEAFETVVGLSPKRFEEDFRRYVVLRGFKRGAMRRLTPAETSSPVPDAADATPAPETREAAAEESSAGAPPAAGDAATGPETR